MAKVLPLNTGEGDLCPLHRGMVIGPRPQTAPSASLSSKHSPGVGESRLTPLISVKSPPPDEPLSLEELEMLVHRRLKERLVNIRTAFRAQDPNGTGSVSCHDFIHIVEALLSLSRSQLNTLLNKVCKNGVTVDYMQFLRTYSRTPTAHRAGSQMRHVPGNSSAMPLHEIQRHLKEQIGSNLKTMIRVFRLFDYNRQGSVQRHEFRRILDNYCLPLTDKEFERVWNYYSPNNMANISYKLFLEKLGFGQIKNANFAPDCAKLELASHRVTPPQKDRPGQDKGPRPASSGSRGDPFPIQGLTPTELNNLFHEKMCVNWRPLWQTLQALDATHSGLVKRHALRAALSSFLFPMGPHLFHKLTSRYGVRATGQVKWKHFMSHFISRGEEDSSAPHSNRTSESYPEDHVDLQQIYSWLNEIFRLLDKRGDGWITRADMRHALEVPQFHLTRRRGSVTTRPAARPRLAQAQTKELLNLLDPMHTGLVHLVALEKLNPSLVATPAGRRAPPPSPTPPESMELTGGTPTQSAEQERNTQQDEKQTTQWANKRPVASVSWSVVENLLKDNLSDQISSVQAALTLCDPSQTGFIRQEDLRKVILHYGTTISLPHFNKLCESWLGSRSGSDTSLVCYNEFLMNLGVPLPDETLPPPACSTDGDSTERQNTPPQTILDPEPRAGVQQLPPSSFPLSVLELVFKRIRESLHQRHVSLTDRIQATTHGPHETLSEGDLRKVLEDSWIILEDKHFHMLTELLGFKNGRMDCAEFLAKYEEMSNRDGREKDSEGNWGKAGDKVRFLTAEQCLAAMKSRIKNIHGDNLAAFRLIDRNSDGVVDGLDFRDLFDSLELTARPKEYQRLLSLVGLHPGGTLNYPEFFSVVQNNGKPHLQQPANELCRFDTNGQGLIFKKGLRHLLFSYNLPLRPDEFEQLWSRYDPEGRGCVTTAAFLDRLGVERDGDSGPAGGPQDLAPVMDQQHADTQASSDAAALQDIEQIMQNNYGAVSDALAQLDKRKDGTVRVADLLSLLHSYGCSVQQDQLTHILLRLKVSMDDNCRKLAYLDFLSVFVDKGEVKCEHHADLCLAVHQVETLEGLSFTQALARMKELVAASSTTLYKAFLTFDQSETGMVSALEFRRVLENICGRQTDNQYRHMLTKLDLNWGHHAVNWKDFLNKCRPASPTKAGEALDRGSITSLPTKTSPIITEVLGRIKELVSGGHQSAILTKAMVDLEDPVHSDTLSKDLEDPVHTDTLSKEQFRQLCDSHLMMKLSPHQFEHVWCRMPVNTMGRLEYREFLKRFGAEDQTTHSEAGNPTDNVPIPSPEPTEMISAAMSRRPKTAGAILQRSKSAPQCSLRASSAVATRGWRRRPLLGSMERTLRGEVQRHWKEIQRRCTEADPHHDGEINTISFLDTLHSLNISVTQEELEHLSMKYDFIKNGRVSYPHFLHPFLLSLGPPEDKQAFERCKLPVPTTKMKDGLLSRRCVEVMLRMNEPLQHSWRCIRRSFLACDRSRTGNVSMQDLKKVLRHFSVNLSEEEFFHLSSYFDANASGTISYDHFLRAFLR